MKGRRWRESLTVVILLMEEATICARLNMAIRETAWRLWSNNLGRTEAVQNVRTSCRTTPPFIFSKWHDGACNSLAILSWEKVWEQIWDNRCKCRTTRYQECRNLFKRYWDCILSRNTHDKPHQSDITIAYSSNQIQRNLQHHKRMVAKLPNKRRSIS